MILEIIIISVASLFICIIAKQTAIYNHYRYINSLRTTIKNLERSLEVKYNFNSEILKINSELIEELNLYKEQMENFDKKIQRLKSQFGGNKEFEKIIKTLKSK